MGVNSANQPLVIAVEPDAVTRELLAIYLEPQGFLVESAATPEALSPPRSEPRLMLVNAEVLTGYSADQLEILSRYAGNAPVHALLECDTGQVPALPILTLSGFLSKPLGLADLFGALAMPVPAKQAGSPGGELCGPRASDHGIEEELQGFQAFINEVGMDRGMIDELSQSFIERCGVYVDGLATALNQQDRAEVDRIAHTMKGMSGNLRFLKMSSLSERIRIAALHGDLETVTGILPELQAHFEGLCAGILRRWPPQD